MKYLPLIWSAWWRKPTESMLTFLAITAAFTLLSVMIGVNLSVRQLVERAPMDRLWVLPRFPDRAASYGFPLAFAGQLAAIDGVIAVAGSRSFGGYHVNPNEPVSIRFVNEGMRLVWTDGPMSTQQWSQLFAMPSGIFVSYKAAEKWHLKKDDTFTLSVLRGGRIDGGNSWDFQVLGVVRDDWNWSGPNGFIVGNLQYLENTLPLNQRSVGYAYEAAVKDADQALQISDQIDRKFANSATATLTVPKRVNEQSYVNRGVSTAALTAAIAGAGLGMILLLTGNAIARSVRERVPEFAILQTLGFRHIHILLLVFIEAAIPCLLGAAVSAALAEALEKWSTHFLPVALARFLDTPMPMLSVLAWTFGLTAAVAAASSVIPVLKLRHQSVTDALAGR